MKQIFNTLASTHKLFQIINPQSKIIVFIIITFYKYL